MNHNKRKMFLLKILRKVQENIEDIKLNPVRIELIKYIDENEIEQEYYLTPSDNYCIVKLNSNGRLRLLLDKNGYLYPATYIKYYCEICKNSYYKDVDAFFEYNYPDTIFCKHCRNNTLRNKFIPGINEFIKMPRTKSLEQIKEIKLNNKWINDFDNKKLEWGILQVQGKKLNKNIKLFYNGESIKSIKYICAKCGNLVEINTPSIIKMKNIFYCVHCIGRGKSYFDLSSEDKGEDTSDSTIIEVRTKIDKKWHKVTFKDFQIKTFAINSNHPMRQLIYQGKICDKLKYKCKNCGKEKVLSWKKFKEKKFTYLCKNCVQVQKTVNAKRSKSLKQAYINNPQLKINLRNQPKRHFKLSEQTKEKLSVSVKKVMKRLDVVNNIMLGTRKRQLKKSPSKIQKIVTDYIYKLINTYQIQNEIIPYANCIKEYPIAICKEDISYMLIDITFPQQKIAIEVLGSHWHKPWICYLKNLASMDSLIEKYKDNKQFSYRLKKDYLRDKELHERGWKIIYITESEVDDGSYELIIDSLIKENELWKYPLNEEDMELLEEEKLIEKDLKDNKNK